MEKKWGGAKVDLSAAWSHPVVTMGHPLLRWQWEWQAYLRGRRHAVTDWTDRAVGGCVEMTGCISIWVKNLANVANMAGWVRRKGATWAGWGPGCLLFSCWLVSLLFSLSLNLSTDLYVQLPICLSFCVLKISLPDTHMKARHKHSVKKIFPHLV